MIHVLPKRSHDALTVLRNTILDLMGMAKRLRPLTVVILLQELDCLHDMVDDLETDILRDLADVVIEAKEEWHLDDVVVLANQAQVEVWS